MMSDIMFEHLTKTYPNGFISVDDVTLKIQDGEFVVFHGPSGCGKSTILRMIGGLEDITSGKIYLGDELLNDILPRDRKLAMAFQNYLLYKYLNVYENMALGLRLRDFPRNVIDSRVNTAAQFLGISDILHEKIKNISDDTFRRLYGREIPDGSWSGEIRMNDAVCQLYYGKGISMASSVLNLGVALGIVDKSGAWFSYKEERIGQGRDNARKYLENNPAIMEEIRKDMKKRGGRK